MASIKTRGPKNERRYYVNYTTGRTPDGKRIQTDRLLKGVEDLKQARQELARVERELAAGRDPFAEAVAPDAVKALLERWRDGLTNRNSADDKSKVTRYLLPKFGDHTIAQIDLPAVMNWVDELQVTELSGQTQRHLLNLLSRFMSWAIERGLATFNPVKMVPAGKRPAGKATSDGPWLEDDDQVQQLVKALGPEVGLMFLVGNRAGMRLGEICGLRLNDLDFLHEGVIRVAHSYGGPLKEDRRGIGKTKTVPAHVDVLQALKLQTARRKLQGARGEDLLFVPAPSKRPRKSAWTGYRKEHIDDLWEEARKATGISISWREATRHSFVSRNLRDGVALDEVSAAVGHSSPVVTQKHYARYVRESYSDKLRGVAN